MAGRVFALALLASASLATSSSSDSCRCFPGDPCWPSTDIWSKFNETVDGNLIATIPLARPCHAPGYDAAECKHLREQWQQPEIHYSSSSSVMAPFFTNGTCDPFHPVSKPCTLGNLVQYAVDVRKPEHISTTLSFVTKHNIRLIVRNTGHDYNGKSTGAGALALWTHHLKDISIDDFHADYYSGKAMKMAAGVQGNEAYRAAHEANLEVVGGECPTVGIAGGYTQGGGHSALSSRYGLAADQVLEWEVVLASSGELVVARRDNEYADLYWALSGGGGGTFGVVWSMTAKAHPGHATSGLNVTFSNTNISQDTFYEAVKLYHSTLPGIVDAGAMSVWQFTNTTFALSPLTGPNIPVKQLEALVQPFTDGLRSLGIKYEMHSQQFDSYLEEFEGMQAPIEVGIAQYGGYLIPRDVVLHNNDALTDAYRAIVDDGAIFIGVGLNVSRALVGADIDQVNAVLPAWRDTLIDTTITTAWNWTAPPAAMVAQQHKMTRDYIPRLQRLAPQSGAYLNEGDFRQPDFQHVFYGDKYDKLRAIKHKYDPSDIFYGRTAVGSEDWQQLHDGRLCRKSACPPEPSALHPAGRVGRFSGSMELL